MQPHVILDSSSLSRTRITGRAKSLRKAVVKRTLPSSDSEISASSRARHPLECPCARFPSAKKRHPRHPSANPCFIQTSSLSNCFRLCHHRTRTHIKQHSIQESEVNSSPCVSEPCACFSLCAHVEMPAWRAVECLDPGPAQSSQTAYEWKVSKLTIQFRIASLQEKSKESPC